MNVFMQRGMVFFLALLLILVSAGCGQTANVSPATRERQTELSNEFVNELKAYYIPVKDDDGKLKELGVPVSTQKATYNIEALNEFYEAYQNGKNTSVTFVFASTSFVVIKLVFEGGYGYYLRYQYDPKAEGPLPVSNKLIDSLSMVPNEELDKVDLTLIKDKANIATFAFRNVVFAEEDDSEE